jgi:deoxyribose-phosphate aldolase
MEKCPAIPVVLFMTAALVVPFVYNSLNSSKDYKVSSSHSDDDRQPSEETKRKIYRTVKSPNAVNVSDYFDHTLLKCDAAVEQVDALCAEAVKYDFGCVCVNSVYVPRVSTNFHAANSDVRICAVVGFPLGAMSTPAKVYEAKMCIENGANEIDMVIQVGLLKSQRYEDVYNDILAVVDICHNTHHHNKLLSHHYHHYSEHPYVICKVILETCLLTLEEIEIVSHLCGKAGADFIKTSTGFSASGASVMAVELMAQVAEQYKREIPVDVTGMTFNNQTMQVKASGGIRDGVTAVKMIRAGLHPDYKQSIVTRLGTSSSIKILQDLKEMRINTVEELNACASQSISTADALPTDPTTY